MTTMTMTTATMTATTMTTIAITTILITIAMKTITSFMRRRVQDPTPRHIDNFGPTFQA